MADRPPIGSAPRSSRRNAEEGRALFDRDCEALFHPRAGGVEILKRVLSAYDHPERRYHNRNHLVSMAAFLRKYSPDGAVGPVHLAAILWHDAVLVPGEPDNEEKSAALCREDLTSLGFAPIFVERAVDLILMTKEHRAPNDDARGQLFLDADLSVLAAERHLYNDFMNAIRREYGAFSEDTYRAGRLAFLEGMLKRERIFLTERVRREIEFDARKNLIYEIGVLSGGKRLEGTFSRAANGRLTYEVFLAVPDMFFAAAELMRAEFGFDRFSEPVSGAGEVAGECFRDGVKLLWGWDNWSGFYLM